MIEIDGIVRSAAEWEKAVKKRISRNTIQLRWNEGIRGKELLLPPKPNGRKRRKSTTMGRMGW